MSLCLNILLYMKGYVPQINYDFLEQKNRFSNSFPHLLFHCKRQSVPYLVFKVLADEQPNLKAI